MVGTRPVVAGFNLPGDTTETLTGTVRELVDMVECEVRDWNAEAADFARYLAPPLGAKTQGVQPYERGKVVIWARFPFDDPDDSDDLEEFMKFCVGYLDNYEYVYANRERLRMLGYGCDG